MNVIFKLSPILLGTLFAVGCAVAPQADDEGGADVDETEEVAVDGQRIITGDNGGTPVNTPCSSSINRACVKQVKMSCNTFCHANVGDCYQDCTQDGFSDCTDQRCP